MIHTEMIPIDANNLAEIGIRARRHADVSMTCGRQYYYDISRRLQFMEVSNYAGLLDKMMLSERRMFLLLLPPLCFQAILRWVKALRLSKHILDLHGSQGF